jgi:hydroxymethylpyrimidine/phosphomethylpyrimidine kinase
MLTSAETVTAVQAFLFQARNSDKSLTVVLDPVMVSTSGHSLVDTDATGAIRSSLLGLANWITPNLPEARVLAQSDGEPASIPDMLSLARQLSDQNPTSHILLKGGHLPLDKQDVSSFKQEGCRVVWLDEDEDGACIDVLELYSETQQRPPIKHLIVDVLYEAGGQGVTLYVSRMVDTTSTHGTGCTLSSAIACAVATAPSGTLSR